MRTLSTRRRHPLAGLLVLAVGLLITGGLYAAVAPKAATAEESASTSDIEAGRQLFLVGCASCHGVNAQGINTEGADGEPGNYGPPLIGVGAAAVDFQVGTGRMPMQNSGAQAWRKPPQMNDEQTRQLAAYVASLGPGPSVPDEEALSSEDADLENGGNIFRVNCAMCHNAAGAGGALTRGKFAPSLKGVESKHIYEAMETGPQNMPVFNDDNISASDKRDVVAYLKALDEQGSPGGISLGSFGPVTEGLYAWTIVLSLLIGCAVWLGAKAK